MRKEFRIFVIGALAIVLFLAFHFHEFIEKYDRVFEVLGIVATALFTATLWLSTRQLWETTRDSVKLLQDEFVAVHRPRIRVKHFWLDGPIEADKPILVSVVVVNTGDLPAKTGRFHIAAHTAVRQERLPNDPFRGISSIDLAFNIPSGHTIHYGGIQLPQLSLGEVRELRDGDKHLYCYAALEYGGETGALRYRTSCCRVLITAYDGALSQARGRFAKPDNDSEYEYAD